MSDYTVQGLEKSVQTLRIERAQLSLFADPVFQHLYDNEETDERGETHFEQVLKFQEPLDLYFLLNYRPFVEAVKATEPGRHLSYKATNADLDKVQDEIQGGKAVVQKMQTFANKLSLHHRQFVMLSSALTSMELYSKIILRQYDIVRDDQFQSLPELNSLMYTIAFRDCAPAYADLRAKVDETIFQLRIEVKRATQDLAMIKTSADFKDFRARLNTAHQIYQSKFARSFKEAQRSAYAASANFGQRITDIKIRNERTRKRRVKKNTKTKYENLNNPHQLGDQARVPVEDEVIHLISFSQVMHGGIVFEKLDKEDEEDEEENDAFGDEDMDGTAVDMDMIEQSQGDNQMNVPPGVELPAGFESIMAPVVVSGF